MGQVIHYQDDLYLLDSLCTFLVDASKLEADAEILGDAVCAVLMQADRSFRLLREMIGANQYLSERQEYLAMLSRCAGMLVTALGNLLNPESTLGQAMRCRTDELQAIRQVHVAALDEMQAVLDTANNPGTSQDDHVSSDEISELLKN